MPDIAFWNKCDNRCVMCTNMGAFARQDSAQYRLKVQIRKLESFLRGGGVYVKNADRTDHVSLTGGEPTLHPDFFQLLAYFRRRLPATPITLLSNGRRFADPAFTARFLKAAKAPFAVGIPVHGPDAETHDGVAGAAGSFSQTVAGLKNLFSLRGGQELEIRLVAHKKSISGLVPTLQFLLKTFPDTALYRVALIHYEIEGMSLKNHRSLSLKLSASAARLDAALPLLRRFADLRLFHFPLCLLRPELRPLCRVTLPAEDRVYPAAKCAACGRKNNCLGLMVEYYKKFGAGELRTLK